MSHKWRSARLRRLSKQGSGGEWWRGKSINSTPTLPKRHTEVAPTISWMCVCVFSQRVNEGEKGNLQTIAPIYLSLTMHQAFHLRLSVYHLIPHNPLRYVFYRCWNQGMVRSTSLPKFTQGISQDSNISSLVPKPLTYCTTLSLAAYTKAILGSWKRGQPKTDMIFKGETMTRHT